MKSAGQLKMWATEATKTLLTLLSGVWARKRQGGAALEQTGPLYHSVVSTCDLSSMAASWKLDFLRILLELPRYMFQKGEQSRSCTTPHSPASEIMQHHCLCSHMPTQIQGGILEEGMTRSHCKKIMWIGDILCGRLWKT